ncbi:MAG: TonB family protein [Bacteroidota bacterium]
MNYDLFSQMILSFGIKAMLRKAFLNKWKANKGLIYTTIVFILLNLIIGERLTFIDNVSHIGGLVPGIILGVFYHLDINHIKGRFVRGFGNILTILFFGGALIIMINILPRYTYHYYTMFRAYVQNEDEAIRILRENDILTDESYYVGLKEADTLWKTNLTMLDGFPVVPDTNIMQDINILTSYAGIRRKALKYFILSIEKDSYIYIDTAEQINSQISTIPMLYYNLRLKPDTSTDITGLKLELFKAYFDKDWFECDFDDAEYFRIAQRDSLGRVQGRVRDYYLPGILQMKGTYENNLMNGLFFYYYPNGQYDAAGFFNDNIKIGKWQHFYRNGQIKSEEIFMNFKERTVSYRDSTGKQMVIDGNGMVEIKYINDIVKETGEYLDGLKHGVWRGFFVTGTPQYEEIYENGELVSGKRVTGSGEIYFYDEIYVSPTPICGEDEYLQYLKDSLQYPEEAIRNGMEGVVIIEFLVDTAGNIPKLKPVTIIGKGCEEEAIRLVKEGSRFFPARMRGKTIAARATYPVVFELD